MPVHNPMRALCVGAAAGLFGAYVMEVWQTGASSLRATAAEKAEREPASGEPSTEKTADAVSLTVRGRPVSRAGRKAAGRRTHYLTGAALGAAYGVAAEAWPKVTTGFGAGFGLAATVVLDEAVVPLLGLSPPPQESALGDHLYGFMAHFIFGVATEAARSALRGD